LGGRLIGWALRAAMLDGLRATIQLIGEVMDERVGRHPDEFAVRAYAAPCSEWSSPPC